MKKFATIISVLAFAAAAVALFVAVSEFIARRREMFDCDCEDFDDDMFDSDLDFYSDSQDKSDEFPVEEPASENED